MRVYELAKQLNVSGRDILLLLEELGVGGRTASSRVPPEYLDVIRVRLGGGARRARSDGRGQAEADGGASSGSGRTGPHRPSLLSP